MRLIEVEKHSAIVDHLESLIQDFLTLGGSVFVSPQFNVAWDKEAAHGGASPDFVALDFVKKHVVIVEMTTAYSLERFLKISGPAIPDGSNQLANIYL